MQNVNLLKLHHKSKKGHKNKSLKIVTEDIFDHTLQKKGCKLDLYGGAHIPYILPDDNVFFQSEVIFLVRGEPFQTHFFTKNKIWIKSQFLQ